jgi:hypothetical protein
VQIALQLAPRAAAAPVVLSWQSERVGWMGYGETYPERQFPELAFALDGAAASVASRDLVTLGEDDISALVAGAGLDPFSITGTPPFAAPLGGPSPARTGARAADPAASAAHAELLRRGAIEDAKEGELAKWSAQRRLELALPPGRHSLRVTYDARPALEIATRAALAAPATARRYCVAPADLPKAAAAGGWVIARYALPLGIDSLAPTAATLAIEADAKAAGARWFACGPGRHAVKASGALAPTPVATDATGVLHVLRIAPAMPG